MFKFLKDIAKASVGVVTLPVTAVADVVTMGGFLTDKKQSYTSSRVSEILDNLENAVKPS